MTCVRCRQEIEIGGAVLVNGRPVHPRCTGAEVRAAVDLVAGAAAAGGAARPELTVRVEGGVDAIAAYQAGRDSSAELERLATCPTCGHLQGLHVGKGGRCLAHGCRCGRPPTKPPPKAPRKPREGRGVKGKGSKALRNR